VLTRERQATKALNHIYKSGKTVDVRLRVGLEEMLNMGGLYVKFAQLLLLNQTFSQTIPPELRREVFDRVRVNTDLSLKDYFTTSDLELLDREIATIDPKPRYAGSFAAVFDAATKDGQTVVIKVLRPGLLDSLNHDLRIIRIMARSIGLFKSDVKAALEGTFRDFRTTSLRETDYISEVRNAKRLAEEFHDDPIIYIPRTYESLCTPKFIVQEKLEGLWLTELLKDDNYRGEAATAFVRKQLGSDLKYQLYYLGWRSLHASLIGRAVHGDPHPGNIVLMEHNRVGLIDFGIIAEPVTNRLALLEYVKEQILNKEGDVDIARLMISIVRFHANNLYLAVERLSSIYGRPLIRDLYMFLQDEVERNEKNIDKNAAGNGQYSNMLSGGINKDNRFGLLPKIDSPLTQKAFITIWRTYEELGFADLQLDVFKSVVATVEHENNPAFWQETKMPVDQAIEIVAAWLNRVAEADPQLFMNLRSIFQSENFPEQLS
jgi:serine/threonine protein kinase